MFTQKISMDCTKEQYEKYLKDELLKMGYTEVVLVFGYDKSIIVNNLDGYMGDLASLNPTRKNNKGRLYLGSFNPELFLALAAMTDSERIFGYREWAKQKNGNDFQLSIKGENCNPYWRKATKEEIIERFGTDKMPMWESCSNIINNLENIYTAIELLKSKGYKILKPTNWEEV